MDTDHPKREAELALLVQRAPKLIFRADPATLDVPELSEVTSKWLRENESCVLWHLELQFLRILAAHPKQIEVWSSAMKLYMKA